MVKVTTLYSCIICGASWDKLQSLRAHMKVHQDIEWGRFEVRIPKEKIDRFKKICRKHKTTTCHLIMKLIDATLAGEESGLIELGSPNPMTVNVMSFFSGRPRGRRKWDLSLLAADRLTGIVRCKHLSHKDWNRGRLGWCHHIEKWVTEVICGSCTVC